MTFNEYINKLREELDKTEDYLDEAILNEEFTNKFSKKEDNEYAFQRGRNSGLREALKFAKQLDLNSKPNAKVDESINIHGPNLENMEIITQDSRPTGAGGFTVQRWEDIKKTSNSGNSLTPNVENQMLNLANQEAVDDVGLDDMNEYLK